MSRNFNDIKYWLKQLKEFPKSKKEQQICDYLLRWMKGDLGAKDSFNRLYNDAYENKIHVSYLLSLVIDAIYDHILSNDYAHIYDMMDRTFQYICEKWYEKNTGKFTVGDLIEECLDGCCHGCTCTETLQLAADNVYNKNTDVVKRFNNRFMCNTTSGINSGVGECKIKELI